VLLLQPISCWQELQAALRPDPESVRLDEASEVDQQHQSLWVRQG